MRKRVLLVLVLFWCVLAAVIWQPLQPVATDWITPRLAAFDPHDASLIAKVAAYGFPLVVAAAVVLLVFLLARPTGPQPRANRTGPMVRRAASKVIRIKPDQTLVNAGLRFGLQPVANGKDRSRPEEIYFKKLNDRGSLMAQIPYDERHAVQFRCFVDYKGTKLERVRHALAASGYRPMTAKANTFRIWFLLPNYRTTKSVGGPPSNVVDRP